MDKILKILMLSFFTQCAHFKKNEKPLNRLNRWYYQLQKYDKKDILKLSKLKNHLIVLDYSKDGSFKYMFSRKFIQKLKKNNNIVLSYLSIGEAESYRFYFKNMNKKILIKENPNWKENFVIHFQHPEWKEIIYRGENSYLSQIKKIGFDGVYLDRIDVFEEFKDYQNQAKKMADFVIDLSKYAKKINPEFIVVAQNASNIINYLSDKDQYLNSIDGLAIEDLFYLGNKKHDNDYKPQTEVLKEIKFYKRKNIKIFSVEYLKDIKKIKKYKKLAKKYGLVHLIANRALSGD